MNKVTAKEISPKGGAQYHIKCRPGDLAKYVLLPGNPGRVEKIAKCWDDFKEVAYNREFHSVTGHYKKTKISCLSTGLGSPSAAIAIEEAARIGSDTFIRVGSAGAFQTEIKPGDLVINTGAVRHEGTSHLYVSGEYPALASYEIVLALIEACEKLGFKYHLGLSVSTDSFYVGEGRPGIGGYTQSQFKNVISDWQKAKVATVEMEAAVLFTIANLYRLRAGCILAVYDNLITNEFKKAGEKEACQAAAEAVSILAEWDKLKKQKRKKIFYPSLLNR